MIDAAAIIDRARDDLTNAVEALNAAISVYAKDNATPEQARHFQHCWQEAQFAQQHFEAACQMRALLERGDVH